MIRIIKEGKTDFRITCDKCGCIFEYNVADIDDCYIKCPTCGKQHYAFEAELTTDFIQPYTFGDGLARSSSCEYCPVYKMLQTDQVYIGDTPCQWCSKNPYRVTCNDISTASYRDKSVRVSYTTGATTGGISED